MEITWKKATVNKTFTTYQKGEEDNFLTVMRQTYNSHAWGYNKPTDFIVSVGTCSTKHTEKHFKRKYEALKFAKDYMEENK